MKPEDKKRLEEIRTFHRGNYWNPYPLDFLLRLVDEGQENYLFMCAEYDKAEAQLTKAEEENRKLLLIAREYLEGK